MRIRQFCVGVGLTSGASLALSLLFTRIFSVTMYYHFAFLLVSLALLGIAVSGVAVYLLPRVFTPERLPWMAGMFAVAMAPLCLLSLWVAVNNPMSVDLQGENIHRLLKLYAATALPFLASGFAISLAIAGAGRHIGRLYAFDLVGAGIGCVLIVPLISSVGGQAAVLVAGAIAACGGVAMAGSSLGNRIPVRAVAAAGVVAAIGMTWLALGPARSGNAFKIAQGTKFLNEKAVEFERWNAFSRVTVSTGEPDYKWIHIDADAATRMYSGASARDNYAGPRRFSETRVAGLVYAVRSEGPALVIGPGGGPDVLSALRSGASPIMAVEINPVIAEGVMRERYADYNGDLYRNPRVQLYVEDGRSYVRRSHHAFSSIQATLVDTWAASAAGAFTLTENNLYTVEAFTDYLDHLQPDGIVSMTRWYGAPPVEFLRLMGLGREALSRRGVPEQEQYRYFFVASDFRMATLLLKQQPFAPAEVQKLEAECNASGLRVLFSPFGSPRLDPLLSRYLSMPASEFYERVPFDVSPTTDNRPFFFYTVRPADFTKLLGRFGNLERNNLGLALLQVLLLVSTGLTLLLVVLPLVAFRRDVLLERRAGKLRVLAYFLCLGLGFILVEMGLMQRFVLFLGHPTYALAVVLATLLASSGAGSELSRILEARLGIGRAVRQVVAAVTALLLLYLVGLRPLFGALLGLPLTARVVVSALLVALLGVPMGTLLPLGVRQAQAYGADLVPWAWGLNGATSVVGSILAVVLSMHFGFSTTLLTGLFAYLLATGLLGAAGAMSAATSEEVRPHPAVKPAT